MISRSATSRFGLVAVLGLVSLGCPKGFGAEGSKKSAVPGEAAQQQARQVIGDVYGKEIQAAETPEQARAMTQKLLKTASESKEDSANQYVLLREAGRLAMKAGDLSTAMESIDRMDALFLIDAISMKLAVVGSATKKIATPAAGKALAGIALEVAQDAVERDKYDAARQAAATAAAAANRAKDASIVRSVKEHRKRIEEMAAAYEEIRPAVAALEKNPTDASSNLAVGRYRILQGNWEEALRLLALGGDKAQADLAAADAAGASVAEGQVKLGDRWWNQAEKEERLLNEKMRRRAVAWYERALPNVAGLTKARVEKRIAEVKALGDENSPEATAKLRRGSKVYLDDLQETAAAIGFGQLGKHGESYWAGEKIVFRGVTPSHALATHPPAQGSTTVTYDLKGEYKAFSATVGLWAAVQAENPVVFRVWCDDGLAWESRPLQNPGDGQMCTVPLRRVRRLKLEVHCDGHYANAYAAWFEPCLVK